MQTYTDTKVQTTNINTYTLTHIELQTDKTWQQHSYDAMFQKKAKYPGKVV